MVTYHEQISGNIIEFACPFIWGTSEYSVPETLQCILGVLRHIEWHSDILELWKYLIED